MITYLSSSFSRSYRMPTIGYRAIKPDLFRVVDISQIKGTYANGNTSYTTPNLLSGDSYTLRFRLQGYGEVRGWTALTVQTVRLPSSRSR